MDKAEARDKMRLRRSCLQPEDRAMMEEQAMKRLLSMQEVQEAAWIYPFVSCRTEMDTKALIQILLDRGEQNIAVPRVRGAEMEFVAIDAWKELQPGAMGILEPVGGEVVVADHGVMLMPGLAFDLQGNRVGYGAGYYDKYLDRYDNESLYKIAYAFDFQVVDGIEAEDHDRRVNAIVTDRRIQRFIERD